MDPLRRNLANQEGAHATIASLRAHFEKEGENKETLSLLESLYTQAVYYLETEAVALEEEKVFPDDIYPFSLLQWIGEHLTELPTNLNDALKTFLGSPAYLSASSFQPLLEDPRSYSSTEFVKFLLERVGDPTQNDSQTLMAALEYGNQEAATLLRKCGCSLLTKVDNEGNYEGRLPHGITYTLSPSEFRSHDESVKLMNVSINWVAFEETCGNVCFIICFMKTNYTISKSKFKVQPSGRTNTVCIVETYGPDDSFELTFVATG